MSAWFPFPSQETVEKEFQLSFVKLDNMLHDYYSKSKEHEAFVNQVSYFVQWTVLCVLLFYGKSNILIIVSG